MKEIKLSYRTVRVDIDKLAKGLFDIHCEDKDVKTRLCFGMLEAEYMEEFEREFNKILRDQFADDLKETFASQINAFNQVCLKDITKRIYYHAKDVLRV